MRKRTMLTDQNTGQIRKNIRTPSATYDTKYHKEEAVILYSADKDDIGQKAGDYKCNKHCHRRFTEFRLLKICHQHNKQRYKIDERDDDYAVIRASAGVKKIARQKRKRYRCSVDQAGDQQFFLCRAPGTGQNLPNADADQGGDCNLKKRRKGGNCK